MAREVLPRELVERIVASFEAYLPAGVYLTLRDDGFSVRSVKTAGGGWFGPRPGALPWPPMPASTKWRLGVQSVYETVAHGIGRVNVPLPHPLTSDSAHAEMSWPARRCTSHVTVSRNVISARYLDAEGHNALSMPPIEWQERDTEPASRQSSPGTGDEQRPTIYVGPVPEKVRKQDAADDERQAARDTARTAILEEVKSTEPGTDKDKIRAAFRAAFARHPDKANPPPGSHVEDRLVDWYAATNGYATSPGPAAAAGIAVELGKSAWDLAKVFRSAKPDHSGSEPDT